MDKQRQKSLRMLFGLIIASWVVIGFGVWMLVK